MARSRETWQLSSESVCKHTRRLLSEIVKPADSIKKESNRERGGILRFLSYYYINRENPIFRCLSAICGLAGFLPKFPKRQQELPQARWIPRESPRFGIVFWILLASQD